MRVQDVSLYGCMGFYKGGYLGFDRNSFVSKYPKVVAGCIIKGCEITEAMPREGTPKVGID